MYTALTKSLINERITGTATVENSMEIPPKTESGTAFWARDSIAGIRP